MKCLVASVQLLKETRKVSAISNANLMRISFTDMNTFPTSKKEKATLATTQQNDGVCEEAEYNNMAWNNSYCFKV